MDRVTLAMLEVTDGDLPAATLTFRKGLNVLSGAENRGKTYAVTCLDYLLGAKDPPESNRHSEGYATAFLYFTINDVRRGVIRRHLESGDADCLPYHPIDQDVPADWTRLAKGHTARSESISSYWLSAFAINATQLRGKLNGDVKALTVRYIAHLVLVDELRIMEKRSPARSSQATAWTADGDALALMLGARKNPPGRPPVATAQPGQMSDDVRSFVEKEIELLDSQIQAFPDEDAIPTDEAEEVSRRAEAFTAAASTAAADLREILSRVAGTQQALAEAKRKYVASREIASRLTLLREYYQSDLRRLEAINETAFLIEQLNPVPCPACLQPIVTPESEGGFDITPEHVEKIRLGARVEAAKIRGLEADLAEALARASGEAVESQANERTLSENLESLRAATESQGATVAAGHASLSQMFTSLGERAERQSLRQRRAALQSQLAASPATTAPPEVRTEFDLQVMQDFCDVVRRLLEAWKWDYTPPPLIVSFDQGVTDIVISGEARSSFGKAVRAILSSAFLLGIMDYCFDKNLPHPGFVILDSPLTTKREGERSSGDDASVKDEILTAFFQHLATQYNDRQVIVIDNKEPPDRLAEVINHIRFDDDADATSQGFFPSLVGR